MSATERRGLFAGLAALSAAVVVLELALTRVAAAVLAPEAAGGVAPLALVAGALGALAIATRPEDEARPTIAVLTEIAAACSVAAVMVALHVSDSKPAPGAEVVALGGRSRGEAIVLAAVASLPFAFGGAATAAALRAVGAAVGAGVAALGAGVAVGTVGGVIAVRSGAPRAALVAAVLFGLAAAALTAAARARAAATPPPPEPPDHIPSATDLSLAATAVVGSLVLLAGDIGAPWLKLKVARIGLPDRVEIHRWSELGLVTVDRAHNGVAGLRVDGVRRGALADGRGNPGPEPEDLAFAFSPDKGPTLVVDPAGAGRTVRAALKAGQKDVGCVVTGVALAHELSAGELRAFGATLHGDARVRTELGDGRAEVRRSPGGLRLIVVSAATAGEVPPVVWPRAGGDASAAEAALVTREALVDDLARLAPEGAVVLRTGPDPERLVRTALDALRATGAADPASHVLACGAKDASAVLVRKTPLALGDVRTLRAHCQRAKLAELLAPDQPKSDLARRLAGERPAPPAASAVAPPPVGSASAAAPPPPPPPPLGPSDVATDDRPFVALAAPTAGGVPSQPGERLPFVAGLAGLAVFAAAGAFARARGGPGRGGAGAAIAAGFLGVGTAALEALVGRWLTAALGHPVFALLLVAPALAAGLGVGALLVERTPPPAAGARAARLAVAGSLLLLLGGLALGPLARAVSAAPAPARIVVAIVVVGVVAVPVGGLLPLLLGLARAREGGTATAFALHLIGQLVAIGLGSLVVVHIGFLALAACAAGAFGAVASLARGSTPADEPAPPAV